MRATFRASAAGVASCEPTLLSMLRNGGRHGARWAVALTLFILALTEIALAHDLIQVREGARSYGAVILTIDGDKVRRGNASYGEVIFVIDGNRIRQGKAKYGTILATADEDGRIREGARSYGKVIARVAGDKVIAGDASYGPVIARTDGGLMAGAAAACFLLLQ